MHSEKLCILCLVLNLVAYPAPAAPYSDYENEISAALAQRVPQHEILWLKAAGRDFLGLYREPAAGVVQGVAIIVHGMGGHADWPEVIAPLRMRLPEAGWASLSLQMPVLPPGAPLADYGRTVQASGYRISAALQYLEKQGYINIISIGYGYGAALIADYLAFNPGNRMGAFVGVSVQSHEFLNPRLKLLNDLASIDIPVLDIYAGRDRGRVLRQADDRRLAGRKNGRHIYDQIMIGGADRFYTGKENVMTSRICGWLEQTIPHVLVNVDSSTEGKIKPETGENNDEQ